MVNCPRESRENRSKEVAEGDMLHHLRLGIEVARVSIKGLEVQCQR